MTVSRFISPAQGIVNANGTITFTFNPPPQGTVQTGTISIPTSPPATKWSVNINGTTVTSILGANPAGGIQVFPNEVLTVVGTNLIPGNVYNAVYSGVAGDIDEVSAIAPAAATQNLISGGSANLLYSGVYIPGTSFPLELNLQTTTRSLLIAAATSSAVGILPVVVGNNSGINWASLMAPAAGSVIAGGGLLSYPLPAALNMPCYGIIDTSVSIQFKAPVNAGITIYIAEMPDEIILGGPEQPVITQDTLLTTAVTPFSITIANGFNGSILAAPTTGFNYLIEYMEISVAAATAASAPRIAGTTSGLLYLQLPTVAGTTGQIAVAPAHMVVGEGFNGINAAGVSAGIIIVYRLISDLG